jgi:hypothetical protein
MTQALSAAGRSLALKNLWQFDLELIGMLMVADLLGDRALRSRTGLFHA